MTQLEKDYANDPAKAKARDLLRGMVDRTLLRFQKPSDLYVLCFPGIDAAEIHQVYDQLGIPRENITGIEKDPRVAQALEKKKLGIRIVNQSIENFVKEQESFDFNVVSLDYCGLINEKQIGSLGKLLRKNEKNEIVVHQANLAKRDGSRASLYAFNLLTSDEERDMTKPFLCEGRSSLTAELIKETKELNDVLTEESAGLGKVRTKSYSRLIERELYGGLKARDMGRFANFILGTKEFRELLKTIRERNGTAEICKEERCSTIYEARAVQEITMALVGAKMRNMGIDSPNLQLETWDALISRFSPGKKYMNVQSSPYSYISESGAPMIGEIFFGASFIGKEDAERRLVNTLGYPNKFEIIDEIATLRRLTDYLKTTKEGEIKYKDLAEHRDRVFLGSSAKPVLTKEKAITLLKDGVSISEIKATHRGWKGKPLSQWKAHATMGTYDKSSAEKKEETIRQDPEDSNLETITREQAIDLLASGIPPKEVHAAYPTSFTVGQLAAYLAHINMGTYGKNGEAKVA